MTPTEKIAARIKEMRDQGEHSIALLDAVEKYDAELEALFKYFDSFAQCYGDPEYMAARSIEKLRQNVADLLAPEGK